MLEEFQVLAAGIRSPLIIASSDRLEALGQRGRLSATSFVALCYFDAYLLLTNATSVERVSADLIHGFRGFLRVEFKLDHLYERSVFESLIMLLVEAEFVTKAMALSLGEINEPFYSNCYHQKNRSAQAAEYYESYFKTLEEDVFFVDLTPVSGVYESSTREKLREMLRSYILRRGTYEAQTDVGLITSILGGISTRWPNVLDGGLGLNESESSAFFNEILVESDRQTWIAGLSATEVSLNRQFLLRVILGFFVPSGLLFNLDYQSLM